MPDSTATIVGNVTRDPEIRYTSGGAAKASFSVAVSRRRKRNDEWIEETSFLDVVCWRELAENVGESITKCTRVVCAGRFEQRSWETDKREKRSVVELVADEVAPSLRWATATVNKNERRGDGGRQSAPARSGGRGRDDFGEEPW
jgi:single-strand DNA-binding protein